MERFVRITAPTGKVDFAGKLLVLLIICGGLNHFRDMLQYAPGDRNTFLGNFTDATFTALPMCTFALMLIGHLNSLQQRLYKQATHDFLTGLHNRRWFMDNTPERLKTGQALFIIDVDHFKKINDSFGHEAGDRCLQQMADHLAAAIDAPHPRARVGGEEFALFIPQADRITIDEIAGRICAGFVFDPGCGVPQRVTASVGVAFSMLGQTRNEAFQTADSGTYLAKARGRAGYVVVEDGKP